MNNPIKIEVQNAAALVSESDLFVFACGYEERSRVLPLIQHLMPKQFAFGIHFRGSPDANLLGTRALNEFSLRSLEAGVETYTLQYDALAARQFEERLNELVAMMSKHSLDSITVDVSGMPQFVMMEVFAALRDIFPAARFKILYFAAEKYPPSANEIRRFLAARAAGNLKKYNFGVTFMPGDTLFPARFGGVGQRRGQSVMVLCAGYEKDRSHAAYDAINPTKLVILHSLPNVNGADDRLEYSRAVHEGLGGNIERSVEILRNTDVVEHVEILDEYYHWLYDIYDMVLVPVHSKLQSLACYIFWEWYPDVQIIFPVPVEYSTAKGGIGVGSLYSFDLPPHPSCAGARFGRAASSRL